MKQEKRKENKMIKINLFEKKLKRKSQYFKKVNDEGQQAKVVFD